MATWRMVYMEADTLTRKGSHKVRLQEMTSQCLSIAVNLHRLQVCCDDNDTMIDSGDVIDNEYKGGRLGVYSLSQPDVTFAGISYACPSRSVTAIGSVLYERYT